MDGRGDPRPSKPWPEGDAYGAEAFKRDPHGGELYVFRGQSGKLIIILTRWARHVALRQAAGARPLLWPSSADGVVTVTPAQLGHLLATGECHNRPGDRRRLIDGI